MAVGTITGSNRGVPRGVDPAFIPFRPSLAGPELASPTVFGDVGIVEHGRPRIQGFPIIVRNINGQSIERQRPERQELARPLAKHPSRGSLGYHKQLMTMLRERRRSRQTAPLAASWSRVTARVRRLVDDVHDGDLAKASAHAGVPYAQLRDIHAGRSRQPGAATLEQLARAHGLPIGWFLSGSTSDDGTIPLTGWDGFLPGADCPGQRIVLPHSAWPLIRVLVQLEQRLRDLPATVDRPIIGAITDPRAIRAKLSAFIFQPLFAATAVGGGGGFDGLRGDRGEATLRGLGQFWERALGGLFPDLTPSEAA